MRRNEDRPFGESIDDDKNRVESFRLWKRFDKVHRYVTPWSDGNLESLEESCSSRFRLFRPLAYCASRDISLDVPVHAEPDIVLRYEFNSLGITLVTCERRVMSRFHD